MYLIQCPCGKKTEVSHKRTKYYSKKCCYEFRIRPSGLTYNISMPNKGWFKKGENGNKKGKMLKNIESYSKDKSSLHKWLRRRYGSPKTCEKCKSIENIQWANKTGKYLRERNDWLSLCAKCHQRYDYEQFNAREKFYGKKDNVRGTSGLYFPEVDRGASMDGNGTPSIKTY